MNDSALARELAPYRQWIVAKRANKIPLNPKTGRNASPINPQDWSDYETVSAIVHEHPDYIAGFVLTKNDDPFVCIDLDSTDDPAILANHAEIFKAFDSYTEISPSGRGAHIWIKGKGPGARKLSKQCIEVYTHSHYMTVTFNAITNKAVEDRQDLLDSLYASIDKTEAKPNDIAAPVDGPENHTDYAICEMAANASNGDKFKMLYEGRFKQYYRSQSEADLALCNILAFYSDSKGQVGRIFRASKLGQRNKAKRDDYLFDPRYGIVSKSFDNKASQVNSNERTTSIINTPDVEIISMSDITAEKIEWLWPGYLPLGKLSLLAGATGTGKSTLAFSMAATVSKGGDWPDKARCNHPGHVLIWSSEDDAADTIVPRLMAMGATLEQIHLVTATVSNGRRKRFDPATDIPALRAKVTASGVSLLIIDPIVSAVTGDMNKSNEVRRGLQTVVDFAGELNCAVLGISHFAKGTSGRSPAERVIGSVAFAAFARMVLVAAMDNDSNKRVFARAVSNIGRDTGGFYYTVPIVSIGNGIEAAAIEWGETIDGNSRDILATMDSEDTQSNSHTQINEAKQFLLEELQTLPGSASDLIDKAQDQLGISKKTLQRARKELGIQTTKQGINGGWIWTLPSQSAAVPK